MYSKVSGVGHDAELRRSNVSHCADKRAGLNRAGVSPFALDHFAPISQVVELAVQDEKLNDVLKVWSEPGTPGRQVEGGHVMGRRVPSFGQQMGQRAALTVYLDMRVRHPIGRIQKFETKMGVLSTAATIQTFDLSIAKYSPVASIRHR